jgi:hypothetical protein
MDSQNKIPTPNNIPEHENIDRLNDENPYITDLNWLSDITDKATRGGFIFIFKKIPRWTGRFLQLIYNFLVSLLSKQLQRARYFIGKVIIPLLRGMPERIIKWLLGLIKYLSKLVEAMLQILGLVAIVFGPLFATKYLNEDLPLLSVVGSVVWILMWMAGGIWGINSLDSKKWRIRQIIEKISSKFNFQQKDDDQKSVEK